MTTLAEPSSAREALPEAGQLVRVRPRSWLVEEVVSPARSSEQTLVRLSDDLDLLYESVGQVTFCVRVHDGSRRHFRARAEEAVQPPWLWMEGSAGQRQ